MKIPERRKLKHFTIIIILIMLGLTGADCSLNQIKSHIRSLELSPEISKELKPLGWSMNENEKQFIDILPGYSSDTQHRLIKLAGDEEIDINDLAFIDILPDFTQTERDKLIGIVTEDSRVSDDENTGLMYLSGFPDEVRDDLISQFGLNDDVILWLSYLSGLPDKEFAEYAVRNKLCIQGDKQFTELEQNFLTDTDAYAEELFDSYLAALNDGELTEEIARLPDLDSTGTIREEEIEALEDIVYWVNNYAYRATFEKMNGEGIKEVRAYCTPLQMLLAINRYSELGNEELTRFTEDFSLNDLIELAWRNPESPYYYGSGKVWGKNWKEYPAVLERINSPYLVAEFLKDNIPYDISVLIRDEDEPARYRDPEKVYKDKTGICADHAALAFEALIVNGYSYETDFKEDRIACRVLLYKQGYSGHAVCLVYENGEFYLINTGVLRASDPGTRLEGPFDTVEKLAERAFKGWDCYMLCGPNFFYTEKICR
ncbi:MAG: hypothetical protein P8105_04140 [Dehalococcoidia bacterium]